jgi:hypothetical protein
MSQPRPDTPPPVPPTRPPPLQPDYNTTGRICLRCTYELTGLPPAGSCPECGTPIVHSLRGNLLLFSAPEYVARLHLGTVLIITGTITQFVAMLAAFALAASTGLAAAAGGTVGGIWLPLEALVNMAAVAASLVFFAGWWLFSQADPAYLARNDGGTARRLVRATTAAAAALTLLQTTLAWIAIPGGLSIAAVVSLLGVVLWTVQYFASMVYIAWLAPRLPDQSAQAWAKMLLWLGPLLFTVGCLVLFIGPVVAVVLYIMLMDMLRRDLKRIRAQQAFIHSQSGTPGLSPQ